MEEDAAGARRRLPINTLVWPLSANRATRHLILQSSHRGDRTGITSIRRLSLVRPTDSG
mgnify:FL=1